MPHMYGYENVNISPDEKVKRVLRHADLVRFRIGQLEELLETLTPGWEEELKLAKEAQASIRKLIVSVEQRVS